MKRLNSTSKMSQVEETTELSAALEAIFEYLDLHAECKKWTTSQWGEWLNDNSFSLQQLQNDAQKAFGEFKELDALTELQGNLHQNNNEPTLELVQQWQNARQSLTLQQLVAKAASDANEVQNIKKTAGGTSKVGIGLAVTARVGATGFVSYQGIFKPIKGRLDRSGRQKLFDDVGEKLDDPNIDKVLKSHDIKPETAKEYFHKSDLGKRLLPNSEVATKNTNALNDIRHQLDLNDLKANGYLDSPNAKEVYAKAIKKGSKEIPEGFSDVTTWGKPGSEIHKTNSKILKDMQKDAKSKGFSKEEITRTVETAPRSEKEDASAAIDSAQKPQINLEPEAPAKPKLESGLASDANTFVETKTDGFISDATEALDTDASTAAGDASADITEAKTSVERVDTDIEDMDDF